MVDAIGVVRSDLAPIGSVFLQGELWSAEASDGTIPSGRHVRVVQVSGLQLKVRDAESRKKGERGSC